MIEPALLGKVIEALHSLGANASSDSLATAADLRQRFPGIRFTVCSDDDIPPRIPAAAENALCNLYYVDANEHCLKLTSDAEAASGLVVAFHDL
jgi:hypothetical protein